MNKSTYIKLVDGATQKEITLTQVKELFHQYIAQFIKTEDMINWKGLNTSAFPYSIEERFDNNAEYLYLKAQDHLYNYLVIGIGNEEIDGNNINFIQIVTPGDYHCKTGDHVKVSIYANYLAEQLKAELHLSSGQVIQYNLRK